MSAGPQHASRLQLISTMHISRSACCPALCVPGKMVRSSALELGHRASSRPSSEAKTWRKTQRPECRCGLDGLSTRNPKQSCERFRASGQVPKRQRAHNGVQWDKRGRLKRARMAFSNPPNIHVVLQSDGMTPNSRGRDPDVA